MPRHAIVPRTLNRGFAKKQQATRCRSTSWHYVAIAASSSLCHISTAASPAALTTDLLVSRLSFLFYIDMAFALNLSLFFGNVTVVHVMSTTAPVWSSSACLSNKFSSYFSDSFQLFFVSSWKEQKVSSGVGDT